MALCRPGKKEEPIYNRIDADDISLVFKNLKKISESLDKVKDVKAAEPTSIKIPDNS